MSTASAIISQFSHCIQGGQKLQKSEDVLKMRSYNSGLTLWITDRGLSMQQATIIIGITRRDAAFLTFAAATVDARRMGIPP